MFMPLFLDFLEYGTVLAIEKSGSWSKTDIAPGQAVVCLDPSNPPFGGPMYSV